MKILFVGHFAPQSLASWDAEVGSIPGNNVQREIIDELRSGSSVKSLQALVLRPLASWPSAPLIVRGTREGAIQFTPLINLPAIKNLLFSILLLARLLRTRPSHIITYNSYLFENISILFYTKLLNRSAKSAIIIQDVYTETSSIRSLIRSAYERFGLKLTRYFSLVVPISQHIVDDFGLESCHYRVFPGGMTEAARTLSTARLPTENFAVFAGALTPYNGVDIIVREWIRQDVPHELHIFGRGPLYDELDRLSQHHARIQVHGLVPECDVLPWLARARWTFCLRFSRGIDQRYFFPSKFFTLACAPGTVITNESFDAPADLKRLTRVIMDNAKDLKEQIEASLKCASHESTYQKNAHILANYTWKGEVTAILEALNSPD